MNLRCVLRPTSLLKFLYSNACSVASVRSSQCISVSRCLIQTRLISCSLTCRLRGEDVKPPKRRTQRTPEISLYYPDNSMVVTTLTVAEKIAKRRNLLLLDLKNTDPKTKRGMYQLTDSGAYVSHKEDVVDQEKSSQSKSTKLITIHSKIHSSDLLVKCRHISKLVAKNYTVKVGILSDASQDQATLKRILNTITEHLKDKANCVCTGKATHHVIMVHPVGTKQSQE